MAVVPVSGPAIAPIPLAAPQNPNDTKARVPIAAFGGDQASSTAQAAQQLMKVSNDVTSIALAQADASNRTKLAQADTALQTANNTTLYGDGTPENPGFNSLQGQAQIDAAAGTISQLNANRTAALNSLSSVPQAAQDFFAAHSADVISDKLGQVSQRVASARGQVANEASAGRIFANTNAAAMNYGDPDAVANAFQTATAEMGNIAKVQGLPPDTAAENLAQAQGKIGLAIVNRALSVDPSGADAAAVFKQFPALPSDVTSGIESAITTAQQKAMVSGRASLTAQLNDNLASIARTGAPVHLGITNGTINAVLGADEGARVIQQLNDTTKLYNAQQATAFTSPAEDAAALAKLQPGAGSASVPGLYAELARDADALQATIANKYKAIAKDPAGYVRDNNSGVGPLIDAAIKDPSQWPSVAAEMDRHYDQLQVPATNRPVMPAATAQSFVSSVLAQPPEQQAPTVSNLLAGIPDAATRGRVMGDLVNAKLPPAFETMAAMPNSADQTLMASSIGNAKALRDGLQKGDAQAIDNSITSNPGIENLTRSFAFAPGGAVKAGNIVEALKPLAYSYRAQGMSTGDAVARAANSITGAFDFFDNGGQVARVPAGSLGAVEQQADAVVSSLTAPQLAVPANPSGINLTSAQLQSIALQNAQRGAWVTNEGGTGLIRIGQNGNPVKLAGGGRLEMPFPSLNPAANVAPPPPAMAPPQIVPGL